MKTTKIAFLLFIACSFLPVSSHADALPDYMVGKWTIKKGDCKSLERAISISKTRVDRYESSCKIQKVTNTEQNSGEHVYHGIDLVCLNEGERNEERLNIYHKRDNKVFEMYPDGQKVIIYKCSR